MIRATRRTVSMAAAVVACVPFVGNAASAAGSTWTSDASGSWVDTRNWSGGVPNATDAVANFAGAISAARTVGLFSPVTVGSINFNSLIRYSILGGGTITLASSTNAAAVTATLGNHNISVPLSLASNTTFTSTGGTLIISDGISTSDRTVTTQGAGTVEFGLIRAKSLSVHSGTTAITPGGSTAANSVGTLSLAFGSGLDLADKDLQIAHANYDDIRLLIGDGNRGLGHANSPAAIFSSVARADFDHRFGLGELTGAQYKSLGHTTFDGLPVSDSDILVKFTVPGDSNFDGAVNALDFNAVASNFGNGNRQWFTGDFNTDGFVNTLDFTALAQGFGQTAGDPTAAPLSAVVPEPNLPGIGACVAIMCLSKRKSFMH